jgi:hypothetical protein
MTSRLISPDQVADGGLTEENIRQWREDGYLLLNGLIPVELAQEAAVGLANNYHGAPASTGTPHMHPCISEVECNHY